MAGVRGRVVMILALLAVVAAAPGGAHARARPGGSRPLTDPTPPRPLPRSSFEPRPDNRAENHRVPTRRQLRYFRRHSDMPYERRVTGGYRGTTDEIIQWAAHKEGISIDLLR